MTPRRRAAPGALGLAAALALHAAALGAILWPDRLPPPPAPSALEVELATLPAAQVPAAVAAPVLVPPAAALEAVASLEPTVAETLAVAAIDVPEPRPVAIEAPPRPARSPPRLGEAAPASTPSPVAPPTAVADAAAAVEALERATADWRSLVAGRLEREKRYPTSARRRGQEDTVELRFVVDRRGNVLSHTIGRSAGIEVLDREVLALLDRASPLPPPPAEMADERIELRVPIRFTLER